MIGDCPFLRHSRDTSDCITLFVCIASCVLSLTRALLQIHYGFTAIMRPGSGQGVDVGS